MKTIQNNSYSYLPITDLKITKTKCKEIPPNGTINLTDEEFEKSKKINEFLNKGIVTIKKDFIVNKAGIMNKARMQKTVDKSINPLKKQIDNIAQLLKGKINKFNGSEQTKQVQIEVKDLKESIVKMQEAQDLILNKLKNLKITNTTVINNTIADNKKDLNKNNSLHKDNIVAIEEEFMPIIKSDLNTKNIKKKKIKVKSKSSSKNIDNAVQKLKSLRKKKK